jgi:hypothetical protein
LRAVLGKPWLWPHLPAFAIVLAAGRLRGRVGWARTDSLRAMASAPVPPSVDVVVVTYNNVDTVDQCLASFRSGHANLAVTVVDNDSRDGTAEHVAHAHPDVTLVRNERNAGFAAAVNQAGSQAAVTSPSVTGCQDSAAGSDGSMRGTRGVP